jgi:outer membrane protein TolC
LGPFFFVFNILSTFLDIMKCMQLKTTFIIFSILISTSALSVTLTWEECLNFTHENNPTLEASKREWMAARQTENSLWGRYLPSLNATTAATRTGSSSNAGGGIVSNGVILGSTSNSINTTYQAGLNFTQNIFNGLEDKSRIDQAEWQTKNSFWKYVQSKAQISYSLKEAYANLKYAQELKELSQSILERRESNYQLVSARYENGRENKGSVLLAEAYLEQAKLDLIKATDSYKVYETALKSLMNKEHLDTIVLSGEVPIPAIDPRLENFNELATETPSYNQAYATEMISQESIEIARASFLPDLNLTSLVTRQGESYFPDRERWSVALTLTIPIFDGLRDVGTYKASVETKYANQSRKKSTLLDLIPRLRDALNQAKQSDIKFSIDTKFQKASESRAEIARKKYNNGLLTFEDWDIIENELITRQMNYLSSKRDRILRYASWENLLGKGSIL